MKIKKSQLKKLVKQCVVEVMKEDPRLARGLVKEAIVDIFGERMLMSESSSVPCVQQQRRRKPRGANVPAMMKERTRVEQPSKREIDIEGPDDLYEALAADTMLNTLPDQIAGDRSNPRSASWDEMISSEIAQDDSPNVHLQRAAMMPDPHAEYKHKLMMQQMQHHQQPQVHVPPSPVGEPSQAQLLEMYRQQQRSQGVDAVAQQPQQPQQQPLPSNIPDDLAAIGLGGKSWEHHIDASTQQQSRPTPPAPTGDLAAIAAAANAEFAG